MVGLVRIFALVRCLAMLTFGLLALPASAQVLNVAVAANFKALLVELGADFERQSGLTLRLSSGSTGVLYAQIRHGAPFDVLLAADAKRPQLLEQQGLGVSGTRLTYAIGKLVLFYRAGQADAELLKHWSGKIAIANPKTAPYGEATKAVLTRLGLWQNKRKQLVMGNNIAQTQQFVHSGNVDLAFIALSQSNMMTEQKVWLLPQDWYSPIEQQALVLSKSRQQAQASTFLTWLMSPPIQQKIRQAGYGSTL